MKIVLNGQQQETECQVLLELIEKATGKAAYTGETVDEGIDVDFDADSVEAEMVIAP